MLALGIINSSSFFMWHPKVNLAYSIPHLMNHRTIHRNIKEKLQKNVKRWEKVRKSEKLRKIEKIWSGTDLAIHFLVLKQIEKNWEKLGKIEKNWENVSWKKNRLLLGVKMKQCITDLAQEWTIRLCSTKPYHLHKFVWYFSPRLRMINLSSPIGNHINKLITHTDLKKISPLSLPSHKTNTSCLIHKWKNVISLLSFALILSLQVLDVSYRSYSLTCWTCLIEHLFSHVRKCLPFFLKFFSLFITFYHFLTYLNIFYHFSGDHLCIQNPSKTNPSKSGYQHRCPDKKRICHLMYWCKIRALLPGNGVRTLTCRSGPRFSGTWHARRCLGLQSPQRNTSWSGGSFNPRIRNEWWNGASVLSTTSWCRCGCEIDQCRKRLSLSARLPA